MGLCIDVVLGAFIVHGDDVLFPLRVGTGNSKADVCDSERVGSGNSFADCLDQHPSFTFIVASSRQLGLPFHLTEEQVGRACHLDFSHLLLVDKLNGGVAELCTYQLGEGVPVQEAIAGSPIEWRVLVILFFVFFIGVVDELVSKVHPPVFRWSLE